MWRIFIFLLIGCYERIDIKSQPTEYHATEDGFEDCKFLCGFGKDSIWCKGKRHVIRTKECNIVEQVFESRWRTPKTYNTIENICTYDYSMKGSCFNYEK